MGECYFCGKPGAIKKCSKCKKAKYCNALCQKGHWTLKLSAHKKQCSSSSNSQNVDGTAIKKANYDSFVATLPSCGFLEGLNFKWSAVRSDPQLLQLAKRIGYPLKNEFFRLHEFLQALVSHGQDTKLIMNAMFGFQISAEERERNSEWNKMDMGLHKNTGDWRSRSCCSPIKCGTTCHGTCHRIPIDPHQNIGREWFEARIIVACGVGADKGTYAYDMGARAPLPIPQGCGASQDVLQGLKRWSFPYVRKLHGECNECVVCTEGIFENSTVQLLPTCKHMFHERCLTQWLRRNASCPTCRKRIPESIPRPPSDQEWNMAARLSKLQREFEGPAQRRPLTNGLSTWSGRYMNRPQVIFKLSDELDFSGGACNFSVSHNGNCIAIASTSLGKVAFVSTNDGSLIGNPHSVGKGFPSGPKSIILQELSNDGKEGTVVVRVDGEISKFQWNNLSARGNPLSKLHKQWSVPGGEYLSVDESGNILVSDSSTLPVWITNQHGNITEQTVQYEKDNDYSSFHTQCIDLAGELPPGGVLALPSGDICFLHGLFVSGDDNLISVGVLRRGQRLIEKIRVHGLKRSDFGGGSFPSAEFCVAPNGDLYAAITILDSAIQPLIHITNPVLNGECRGKCTKLQGFRKFEQFEGISVDKGNCVFLLVVNNWPCEREIYLVNPKSG
mmetsp:Transcript_26308/g.32259  ORF Transcript_26308/g.32259 Transcript_26308/m.32259 type:complete len:672 (-) Transcript_26308:79-2094(-)